VAQVVKSMPKQVWGPEFKPHLKKKKKKKKETQ
jgi:hypothetical protein